MKVSELRCSIIQFVEAGNVVSVEYGIRFVAAELPGHFPRHSRTP